MKNKKLKIAIIVVLAILVICGGVVGVLVAIKNNQDANTIRAIQIRSWPTLEYVVDDEADYSGLEIQVVMMNGDVKTVPYLGNEQDFAFRGFNSERVVESQRITVTYKQEYTVAFNVKINPKPTASLVLSHIEISVLPRTEYRVEEWLETDGGMIRRYYTNGTHSDTLLLPNHIDEVSWLNAYNSGVGTHTITVRYSEGGVLVETTYSITISE